MIQIEEQRWAEIQQELKGLREYKKVVEDFVTHVHEHDRPYDTLIQRLANLLDYAFDHQDYVKDRVDTYANTNRSNS